MKFCSLYKGCAFSLSLFAMQIVPFSILGLFVSSMPTRASLNGIGDPQQQQELQSLQYQDPSSSQFVNAPATLYVLVGTTVTFHAQVVNGIDPNHLSYSWGGVASGSTDNVNVTFSQLSQSTSDTFMVTVQSNGQILTANILVFDFSISAVPDTIFDGRSYDDFGVGENVTVSPLLSPSGLTSSTVGGLGLATSSGLSPINNGDGSASFEIPETDVDTDYNATLIMLKGPSTGIGHNKIVHGRVPSGIVQVKSSGTIHDANSWSDGFQAKVYVKPANVAFKGITIQEGSCTAQATNNLSAFNGITHSALHDSLTVTNPVPGLGSATTGLDTAWSGSLAPRKNGSSYQAYFQGQGGAGTFDWNIPVTWTKGSTHKLTTVNHHATSDTSGNATLTKALASDSANYRDPAENTNLEP